MSTRLLCLVTVFATLSLSFALVKITKCRHDDSKCIKESATSLIKIFIHGIKEYGVTVSDPLFLNFVDSSSPSLRLLINNVTVTGLSDCTVRKIERNITKSTILVKGTCSGHMEGQYEMKGRILILPIEGKGKVIANLRKVKIRAVLNMKDITGQDGKQHWNIKNWSHTFELKEKSDLVFENLFNGNELLGRAARELISSNSNDIILEIGPPVIKAIVGSLVNNVNKMFHILPAEDLTLD